MSEWVGLDELKHDMKIDADDTRDDEQLEQVLAAARVVVERIRPDLNYDADPTSGDPEPDKAVKLGTVRLAGRWHTRRRSPDGLVTMAEMGSANVPRFDPDIDRLLGIGPVIA